MPTQNLRLQHLAPPIQGCAPLAISTGQTHFRQAKPITPRVALTESLFALRVGLAVVEFPANEKLSRGH
jgi:hypothetical protein